MTQVAVIGAGRMGRGITLTYIYAGIPVKLIDIKDRNESERKVLSDGVDQELSADLRFLASQSLIPEEEIDSILSLYNLSFIEEISSIHDCEVIYDAVPEVLDVKKETFDKVCCHASDSATIASTTSTFLVTDLADFVTHPERFLNAHWLNPAHLMPLVEVSISETTSSSVVERFVKSLENIGKKPVICNASPGYIVPRIQAIAMNEAARLVEEGVATAEEVDKAILYGFGMRFSVLGMLEFIDWGGGDILYYASQYLTEKAGSRYEVPDVVRQNMELGKNGLRDGMGFFDYRSIDVDAYRNRRLSDFVHALQQRDLLPVHRKADN